MFVFERYMLFFEKRVEKLLDKNSQFEGKIDFFEGRGGCDFVI